MAIYAAVRNRAVACISIEFICNGLHIDSTPKGSRTVKTNLSEPRRFRRVRDGTGFRERSYARSRQGFIALWPAPGEPAARRRF